MVNIEVYHSFLLPSLLHCKSQFEDKLLSSKIMVPSSIFLTQRGLILRHWEDSEYRDKNGEDGVLLFSSVQFNSVTQSCPTLCNPMNCSTPGLPVHHQLPEFTQTHVHRVGDAIQPSHPLSSPSPPAPSPSQHQSLFQRVKSLHQVAKVLEFQL